MEINDRLQDPTKLFTHPRIIVVQSSAIAERITRLRLSNKDVDILIIYVEKHDLQPTQVTNVFLATT